MVGFPFAGPPIGRCRWPLNENRSLEGSQYDQYNQFYFFISIDCLQVDKSMKTDSHNSNSRNCYQLYRFSLILISKSLADNVCVRMGMIMG